MNNGFVWKDSHSDEYKLVCESLPGKDTADERFYKHVVPGRNGYLIEMENTLESLTKSVTFHMLDETNVDGLKAWLRGTDKVIFSNQEDRYYNATIVNKMELAELIPILHKGIIQFECQPLGYLLDGDNKITLTTPTNINNPGTYYSEPLIRIYGSGNISFYINNQYLKIDNVNEYVDIDTELDEVFKGTVSMDNKSSGDTPILEVGENDITWNGTVTKVEIIPRWRCL